MILRSRSGAKLAFVYLAVFLLTEFIALFALVFETATSELSAVLSIVATLPWSILLLQVCAWAGYIKWYDRFAGTPALYWFFAMLAILPGAVINATIVYYIGRTLGGGSKTAKCH